MCESCDTNIEAIWNNLKENQVYNTPDGIKGVTYAISELAPKHIRITPQNIIIERQAFSETIHYLKTNHHEKGNALEIHSSNDPILSGPLCKVSRANNRNVRCINYILPILCKYNLVGIKSTRPNKTWII